MQRILPWLIVVLVVAAGIGGYYYWWRSEESPPTVAAPPPPAPKAEETPPPVAAAPPAIQHPIEEAQPPQEVPKENVALPPLDESDRTVTDTLVALLGADAVGRFLNATGFVRRVVATVDNLPRDRAPSRVWPVHPIGGTVDVSGAGDDTVLAPDNARRYAAFVTFVEGVDSRQAVAAYVRLYPLFQKAYEELGYPNRYFNDRLVEVIDHLLAAPEPAGPLRLVRPPVKGPIELQGPYARYDFADPALESRSAGQKIMVRVGPENEKRLKAKLREVRRLLVAGVK